MEIPHVTTLPTRILRAHAQDLLWCLQDGFDLVNSYDEARVLAIYGDYPTLALFRDEYNRLIRFNTFWGAKLVESPEAPDHTFVLAAEHTQKQALVVHVEVVFN